MGVRRVDSEGGVVDRAEVDPRAPQEKSRVDTEEEQGEQERGSQRPHAAAGTPSTGHLPQKCGPRRAR